MKKMQRFLCKGSYAKVRMRSLKQITGARNDSSPGFQYHLALTLASVASVMRGTGWYPILGSFILTWPMSPKPQQCPENATSFLIELELYGKDERVSHDERCTIISNCIVLCHWLTSEVRSKSDKMTPFEWWRHSDLVTSSWPMVV